MKNWHAVVLIIVLLTCHGLLAYHISQQPLPICSPSAPAVQTLASPVRFTF